MPSLALRLVLIAAGGAAGSVLRFALAGAVQQRLTGSSFLATRATFPWGTLSVNLVGCFAVGLLFPLLHGVLPLREEYKVGLLIGVLGGFTTFSAFGLETYQLVAAGQFKLAAANVLASCSLGLAGVWLGHRLARSAFGA